MLAATGPWTRFPWGRPTPSRSQSLALENALSQDPEVRDEKLSTQVPRESPGLLLELRSVSLASVAEEAAARLKIMPGDA